MRGAADAVRGDMRSQPWFVPVLFALACTTDDGPTSTTESELGEATFVLGISKNRCLDITGSTPDGGGELQARTCNSGPLQHFRFVELDGSHDVRLEIPTTGRCVAIAGPTGAAMAPRQRLIQQPCAATAAQRFAFDGDTLLVGRQANGAVVSRDLVIELLDGDTRHGTPVVTGVRDLNASELWTPLPAGGTEFPHTGFRVVSDFPAFLTALHTASWGSVIVLDAHQQLIEVDCLGLFQRVRAGVTVRSDRHGTSFGSGLHLPAECQVWKEAYLLRLDDHARVTSLRLEGSATGNDDADPDTWAIVIGTDPFTQQNPVPITNAIVDHVDISRWGHAAIFASGHHAATLPNNDCSIVTTVAPTMHVVGNFIHHVLDKYGVLVAHGAAAEIRGNLMFRQSHDVVSSFNQHNQYVLRDNLFTSEVDEYSSAIVDAHGTCEVEGSRWTGGVAGNYYEVMFNAFLTDRDPMISLRGTPCTFMKVRDNVTTQPDDDTTIGFHLEPNDPGAPECVGFVPGTPETVLRTRDANRFDAPNPLRGCPGRVGGGCTTGDLAVGDFDGDNRDDLFFSTGVSWWYSSGGTAEWRFLNEQRDSTSSLRFGDFDHDGRTDVIAVHGSSIEISWGGTSDWFHLNVVAPGTGIAELAVGDFDSDPRDDLFVSDGSRWLWSPAGTASWQFFANQRALTRDLRFGDFTGDGRTDVFMIAGARWRIMTAPGGALQIWNDELVADVARLIAADFTGDGRTDIAWFEPGTLFTPARWKRSNSGSGGAATLRDHVEQPLVPLHVGRFDDNRGADVLYWSNDLWLRIYSGGVTDGPWSRQSMR
jgi:hypothetical protein